MMTHNGASVGNLLAASSSIIDEQHPPVFGLDKWVPPLVSVEFALCLCIR